MPDKPYTVTAYRDSLGRLWELDKRGRWYSGMPADPGSSEDLFDGYADHRFETLADLMASREGLVPLDVDNVGALLATHQATCDQFESYAEDAIDADNDSRNEILALNAVLKAARAVADARYTRAVDMWAALDELKHVLGEFDNREKVEADHA